MGKVAACSTYPHQSIYFHVLSLDLAEVGELRGGVGVVSGAGRQQEQQGEASSIGGSVTVFLA
jgi:hypothetical protein